MMPDQKFILVDDLNAVCTLLEPLREQSAHTLVAFDIDLTLTVAKHPAFYLPNIKQHTHLWEQLLKALSPDEQDRVLTWVIHNNEQALIESHAPMIIQDLQAGGFKVMGLTALLTGPLFEGETLQERRYQSLQALGVNFTSAFAEESIVLKDIASYQDQYPLYHQGILYSNGEQGKHNKGTVLVSFLEKIGFQPKHIVMIDDKVRNLLDIQAALIAWDPSIKFLGIEYVGGQAYGPETIEEAAFLAFWQAHIKQIKQKLVTAPIQKDIS